jgi:hypothetical protein
MAVFDVVTGAIRASATSFDGRLQCSGSGRSRSTFHVMLDSLPERIDCHREYVLRHFPVMGAVLMRNMALPGYMSVLTPTFGL